MVPVPATGDVEGGGSFRLLCLVCLLSSTFLNVHFFFGVYFFCHFSGLTCSSILASDLEEMVFATVSVLF